jgi:hypothetical protein
MQPGMCRQPIWGGHKGKRWAFGRITGSGCRRPKSELTTNQPRDAEKRRSPCGRPRRWPVLGQSFGTMRTATLAVRRPPSGLHFGTEFWDVGSPDFRPRRLRPETYRLWDSSTTEWLCTGLPGAETLVCCSIMLAGPARLYDQTSPVRWSNSVKEPVLPLNCTFASGPCAEAVAAGWTYWLQAISTRTSAITVRTAFV